MKKTMLFVALLATLCLTGCKHEEPEEQVKETNVTLRFLASADLQKFYDMSVSYRINGSRENAAAIVCNDDLDASFVFANHHAYKDYLKGASITVGPVRLTESEADRTITYTVKFTRKTSVKVDPDAKYDLVFGQDISTFDGDKVAGGHSNIFGGIGVSGSIADEYMEKVVKLFADEETIELPMPQ